MSKPKVEKFRKTITPYKRDLSLMCSGMFRECADIDDLDTKLYKIKLACEYCSVTEKSNLEDKEDFWRKYQQLVEDGYAEKPLLWPKLRPITETKRFIATTRALECARIGLDQIITMAEVKPSN